MFSSKQIFPSVITTIFLSGFPTTNALAALTPEEINSLAKQTTVLIAPGLTPELIEALEENRQNPLASEQNPDGVWNPGSGVIIAKRRQSYYVLTVTHNFKQRHLDGNITYGIRTGDGRVHEVKEANDGRGCPLNGKTGIKQQLMRFGCYSRYLATGVEGVDLAIVRFESEENYSVASLGNPENVRLMDRVYVSGWPDPEKERTASGGCRGRVARRKRRLTWGPVTGKIDPQQGQNGYGIFYLDQTRPGMSGGPVFDSNGLVVGVHGRGSQDKGQLVQQYCSIPPNLDNPGFESADLLAQAQVSDPFILHAQFSSAQNLQNFNSLASQIGASLPFNLQPPSPQVIEFALTPLPRGSSSNDVVEFDIGDDITVGSFEDSQDGVDNIYDIFTFRLENQLRDEPSGGCGSLLLGDENERCNRLRL